MNTILSIANGLYQYHKGKQTGLPGLIGILLALLTVWQWDNILPILHKLGIVNFFDKIGLIYDEPYMTGFAIFSFIFKLVIVYCGLVLLVLAIVLLMAVLFNNEKFVMYVLLPIMILVSIPIIYIFVILDSIINWKKHKQYNEELKRKEHENRMLELKSMYEIVLTKNPALKELFEQHSTEIKKEEAFIRLNRLPMYGDDLYVLGFSNFGEPFILTPRPLNVENDNFKKRELSCCAFRIAYKHQEADTKTTYSTNKFAIDWSVSDVGIYSFDTFDHFFITNNKEMERAFDKLNKVLEIEIYNEQKKYFTSKNKLLDDISNAETKEAFESLVKQMDKFDVPNDGVVSMMMANERSTGV
ncbi:hypothetical protein NSQ82_20415 [Caldifermentibacillus hisashii]|uniref:hypothetical protein n=1 Tax=Caldifermentibacillus hisashii TaxID=996558 RepID=UPI0031B7392B